MSGYKLSTSLGFASSVTSGVIGCKHQLMRYWLPSLAKILVIGSLPNYKNHHQQRINNIWPCIVGNLMGDWLYTPINEIFTAFGGNNNCNMLLA
jgi:hypothetical protein